MLVFKSSLTKFLKFQTVFLASPACVSASVRICKYLSGAEDILIENVAMFHPVAKQDIGFIPSLPHRILPLSL